MTLKWHEGTHPWKAHDGYRRHQHSVNGVSPEHGPAIPAPRGKPARHTYILRQTRTRETAFHLIETAPDGTEKTVLAMLPDGIAADVLEAVRTAHENGRQDVLAGQEASP